jgi:hypothetical protein
MRSPHPYAPPTEGNLEKIALRGDIALRGKRNLEIKR